MCLVNLELENLPFFQEDGTLFILIFLLRAILYSYTFMKYIDHSALNIEFSTPISSLSVDILLFIFCFVDKLNTDPFPR